MVYVTAANQSNARLFLTPDIQHFAALEANRVHPDAADSQWRMVKKNQYIGRVTSLNHAHCPVNLRSTNPTCHRTWQMTIKTKTKPPVSLKRKCHRLLTASGRNTVRKFLPQQLPIVVIAGNLPKTVCARAEGAALQQRSFPEARHACGHP